MRRLRAILPFSDRPDNPVLVLTGSGRSGTTWLAEVLASSLGARLVFEPFRPNIVAGLTGLNNRQYLRPEDPAPEFYDGIEAILRGTIRSRWTDRYNDRFVYRMRIIKAIRANLMVGWMLETFPDIRVVHIIRDPFSTVASQQKGGWKFDNSKFTTQIDLMADYLSPFITLIETADTAEKNAALHWAIENYIPVQQAQSGQWSNDRIQVRSYDALRESKEEMIEFLAFAGIPERSIDWTRIQQPSRVSRGRSDFSKPTTRKDLSAGTMEYINSLIVAFELAEWVKPQ